jgi:hypothetical protein
MRLALGALASAVVLFLADAVGAVGSWALLAGVAAVLVSAVVAVIVMEERDLEGLDADQRVLARPSTNAFVK